MLHPFRRSDSLVDRSFDRILIVKPSSLGDVIHGLPVLHGLRVRYPHAKIDWLIASQLAPLLRDQPGLDEVIEFDRGRFAYLGRKPSATAAFLRFVRSLRANRYDLVIDLQGLFRTGFLSWASGAPVRVGFRRSPEAAWIFYSHYLQSDGDAVHAVDRNYLTAGLLGFGDVPIQFNLSVSPSNHENVRGLLRAEGWNGRDRIVAVVPGARWETKMWLADRFTEVIDSISGMDDVCVVLLGSADEVERSRSISQGCRAMPINLTGRTGLVDLPALINLADVVLCHDSAAMHIAVALDRPLVCLVGPTNPARTGPYGRMSDVVSAEVACSPCYLRKMRSCAYEHRCMDEISSDRVVNAVTRALSGGPAVCK